MVNDEFGDALYLFMQIALDHTDLVVKRALDSHSGIISEPGLIVWRKWRQSLPLEILEDFSIVLHISDIIVKMVAVSH